MSSKKRVKNEKEKYEISSNIIPKKRLRRFLNELIEDDVDKMSAMIGLSVLIETIGEKKSDDEIVELGRDICCFLGVHSVDIGYDFM